MVIVRAEKHEALSSWSAEIVHIQCMTPMLASVVSSNSNTPFWKCHKNTLLISETSWACALVVFAKFFLKSRVHLGTLLAKLAHWAYFCTLSNARQFYAKGEKL